MESVHITIAGVAVPGNKKRTRRYADKVTGEWKTMAYNPAHVQKWQQQCRMQAQAAMGDSPPLDAGEKRRTPLDLFLMIFLPIPQSFSGKQRQLALSGVLRPVVRPDLDNYVKAICDAFLGIVFYDDSSIVTCRAGKFYADKPRVEASIARIHLETRTDVEELFK